MCIIFIAILLFLSGKTTGQFAIPMGPYMEYQDSENATVNGMPQGPMMDRVVQILAANVNPQIPFDFFGFLRDSYPLPRGLRQPLAEYDYVIIGAGSAGSVVASRLTEDKPRATVLVIEAGKPEMLLTDVPALAPYFQSTDYRWPYRMEFQPGVCMGMERQRCFWPRGRAVGGSSVINYMVYTRGRVEDWDRIAGDGNIGWSYNEVLPYFKKSERASLIEYNDAWYQGHNGKLSVEHVPFRTPLVRAFLEAGKKLGNPTVDYNAPDGLGFGYVQTTTAKGHRHSAAKAYLHPHKNRRNLHILPDTRATKILINAETKQATGVEYVRNGLRFNVRARREVILSSGPIASPQLLMLSGIGPAKHLKSLGIPVIKNLSVGRTLSDHISFPGVVFLLNTTGVSLIESRESTVGNVLRWLHYGDGVISSPGGIEGIGYLKTPVSDEPGPVPDIELLSIAGSLGSDGGGAIRRGMMITDEVYNSAFGPVNNREAWSAFPMLLHPKSVGYLELKNRNPFSHPKIVGNYLSDRRDIETLIAAIRHVIRLGSSEPFRKFGARLHRPDFPACRNLSFNSDEYWECGIRTLTVTEHHQISTCKMGPPSDVDAVVDPELRVYGIKGLRVVDTSIIPRSTAAHTNAPAMMIGEKAADLIKATWRKR